MEQKGQGDDTVVSVLFFLAFSSNIQEQRVMMEYEMHRPFAESELSRIFWTFWIIPCGSQTTEKNIHRRIYTFAKDTSAFHVEYQEVPGSD